MKRIYVWFDAVIGYLSGSIEWARRTGDPDAEGTGGGTPGPQLLLHERDNVVFRADDLALHALGAQR